MSTFRKDNDRIKIYVIISALVLIVGIVGCFALFYFNAHLTGIRIPDYINISKKEDGSYSFSIDTERIKYDFFFTDDYSLPEYRSLDTLTLLVDRYDGKYRFAVGSTLEDALGMLQQGGYTLYDTNWTWTSDEVARRYNTSFTVQKHICLKDFVRYKADGNYNWQAYIDYDALSASVGDRILYDVSLMNAIQSLFVSATDQKDGTLRIDTYSSYSSAGGITVDDVFHACRIFIYDTVYIIDKSEICSRWQRPLSLKDYCVFTQGDHGIEVEINKSAIVSDYSFSRGSLAYDAVNALSLRIDRIGETYTVSASSSVPDIDISEVLYNNGVTLTDSYFTVTY